LRASFPGYIPTFNYEENILAKSGKLFDPDAIICIGIVKKMCSTDRKLIVCGVCYYIQRTVNKL
jgi:hypothetical protein